MTAFAYTLARARSIGAGLLAAVPPRHEVLIAAGVALVGLGVAMVYLPAGIVVAGLALVAWGAGEARYEAQTGRGVR